MNYDQVYKILKGHLIPQWRKVPVEELINFMREYKFTTSQPWSDAYTFMTASKKREEVLKVWFLMQMLP